MSISDIAGQVKTKRSTCQGRKLQPRGIPVKEGRILAEEAGTAHRGDDAEGGISLSHSHTCAPALPAFPRSAVPRNRCAVIQ